MHRDVGHDDAVGRDLEIARQGNDELHLARALRLGPGHLAAHAGEGHGLRVTEAAVHPAQRLHRGPHERQLRVRHGSLHRHPHHEVGQVPARVHPHRSGRQHRGGAREVEARVLDIAPSTAGGSGLHGHHGIGGQRAPQRHPDVEGHRARQVLFHHDILHVHQDALGDGRRLHRHAQLRDGPAGGGESQVQGARAGPQRHQREHGGHARLRLGVSRRDEPCHQREQRQAPLQVFKEHRSPSFPTKTKC
ncbi:hypothetical protein COSO111634_23375 [Corallococcus soli]